MNSENHGGLIWHSHIHSIPEDHQLLPLFLKSRSLNIKEKKKIKIKIRKRKEAKKRSNKK
uniref:Uncharacterized protein n=1 Tax=Nelumbo nucifera TaxID=4432 RepID=A0A822XK30_NELNU|nr:TPA_asm: hypothetical protein HUJ06_023377 [Nelumbo nucifera]